MTEPGDDVATRGRAIFQRLRAEGPQGSDAPDPAGGTGESPVADVVPVDPAAVAQGEAASAEATIEIPAPAGTPVASVGLSDEDLAAFVSHDDEDEPGPPDTAAPAVTDLPRGPLPGVEELVEAAATAPAAVPDAAETPMLEHSGTPSAEPPPLESDGDAGDPEGETPPVRRSFARDLPRVMAVANQKGGVGKTTTAVNLGACLADIGYRVLVVDLDPQGNASTGLGINIRDLQGSMYDVILHDLPIEDCVEATAVRNLFCAPSSLDLAGAEIELVPAFSRELRLKRALDEVHDDYDFVLIDCPPSLGLLTVNGLAAATEVVVPIQCEYYALEGLGQLLRNVNLVQKNLNPALEVSAIILVMYDARTKLADQVVNEVREHFGDKVCRMVVPRTVRLSEAPSFGQPIIAFDPNSRGAIAYRELAKEVSGGTPQRAR